MQREHERVPAILLGDLTLLRPLAKAKIPVIVATTDAKDPTLKSRHAKNWVLVPGLTEEHDAKTVEILCEIASNVSQNHGMRPPLVYGSDESLAFIYRNRDALERSFLLLLNEPGVAEALLYKDSFARLAAGCGVRTPRSLMTSEQIDRELSSIEGPVIVKPKDKVHWEELKRLMFGPNAKARRFESGPALMADPAFAQCKDALIVQELIPGGEEQLVSFHGFADKRGRLMVSFCGRKIRAFPSPAGESSCIELIVDPELTAYGQSVVEDLGLKGIFKIDIIRDPRDGSYFTLEVNARFNLWHHLAAADGINLPEIVYQHLLYGRAPALDEVSPQHRWVNLYRDFKSYQEQHRQGDLGLWSWMRSITERPTVFEAFEWDDPMPALAWLRGEVAKRFGRWRATAS
jgi:D-aspartate ligase